MEKLSVLYSLGYNQQVTIEKLKKHLLSYGNEKKLCKKTGVYFFLIQKKIFLKLVFTNFWLKSFIDNTDRNRSPVLSPFQQSFPRNYKIL